jgi:hypothetical protein
MWPSWLELRDDAGADRWRFALAVAGFALLGWRLRSSRRRALQNRLLIGFGLLGALAYFNFGGLHFGNFVHTWDTFHYFLGAKYFPELGYERIYQCVAVADAESGLEARVRQRMITDLRTNHRVPAAPLLSDPSPCKAHFTPERWEAFRADVGWFRPRVVPERWELIQRDHGYNASPVWHLLGRPLAAAGPAVGWHMVALALIDPLLLLGSALLLWWAFGWEVAALALGVMGVSFAGRFYWSGGAFLRHDWLFASVAGLCLLRKERPLLAGAAFSYAALVRLFPALLLVGPLAAAVLRWRDSGRVDRSDARLFLGVALAALVLIPAGALVSSGLDAYAGFARNTAKHAATPLTNHMGLRTLVSYRPWTVAARTLGRGDDPWQPWKDARRAGYRQLWPLHLLGALGLLFLVLRAVRSTGGEPWVAVALSVPLLGTLELTCYYYVFLVLLAPLWSRRKEVGALLVGFCAFSGWVFLAPLRFMSRWEDEQYLAMSAAALAAFVGLLLWFGGKTDAVRDGGH